MVPCDSSYKPALFLSSVPQRCRPELIVPLFFLFFPQVKDDKGQDMPADELTAFLVKDRVFKNLAPGAGIKINFIYHAAAAPAKVYHVQGNLLGAMGVAIDYIADGVVLQRRLIMGKLPVEAKRLISQSWLPIK